MDYSAMYEFLMRNLRLLHSPVGVTFLFDEEALENFKHQNSYSVPGRPVTFCQAELGARMEGQVILLEQKKLWCTEASCVFAMDELSDENVHDISKFCTDAEQARRFTESKPRLEKKALAIALSPLNLQKGQADVVHFCCDNMQAYHLIDDWMAVRDVHPFRPSLSVNSAVCGGTAFSFLHQQANMTLACAGSYNSGKMERGEINVMIPGNDLPGMIQRMQARIHNTGGISLTKKGHPFPGADICQNCSVIFFKKK